MDWPKATGHYTTRAPTPGDGIPTIQDEESARRTIRRNQSLATGLLLVMVAVFVTTHLVRYPGFGIALLRSGSEAGIVGGLADWFAVTALFRHPLGLPIPHTAILPNNKARIGRALGTFVERSFLTETVLLPRLRAANPSRRLATWLSAPENAALVAEPVVAALPQILRVVESRELSDFFKEAAGEQLRAIDLAPAVGRVLGLLTQSGEADALFERATDIALQWLEQNRGEIDRLVAQRSRWWVPGAVDRRLARTLIESVSDVLTGLHQPESVSRQKFRSALTGLIDDLMHSPQRREELNEARDRLLQHPDVQAWLNAIWTELSEALAADAVDPSSGTRAALEKTIHSVGTALAADENMQAKIDFSLEKATGQVINYRGEIARFMAEVIEGWDAQTLTERLELVIGSDLQFIRMNGTIVGSLVGCLIFLVTWMAG
ncbi:DUF445 domain-containing protein [Methylobacterium sp. P31]